MDDRENRKYKMFISVRGFGEEYADAFPSSTLGSRLFAAVGEAINQLDAHALAQLSGNGSVRKHTAIKARLRNILRENLAAMSRTARSIASGKRGFDEKFRMPRNNLNDQILIGFARAFVEHAAPFAEEFAKYEMPVDFLEELNNNIALFEKAVSEQNSGMIAQVGATAGIDQAIERGAAAVRQLDAIMRNKFSKDPPMLAAWKSASHTERASRTAAAKQTPATEETPTEADPDKQLNSEED